MTEPGVCHLCTFGSAGCRTSSHLPLERVCGSWGINPLLQHRVPGQQLLTVCEGRCDFNTLPKSGPLALVHCLCQCDRNTLCCVFILFSFTSQMHAEMSDRHETIHIKFLTWQKDSGSYRKRGWILDRIKLICRRVTDCIWRFFYVLNHSSPEIPVTESFIPLSN